jgi:hypothetical protein
MATRDCTGSFDVLRSSAAGLGKADVFFGFNCRAVTGSGLRVLIPGLRGFGVVAKHFERFIPPRLTERGVIPTVSLFGPDDSQAFCLNNDSPFYCHAIHAHSRDVSVLLCMRRHAGVFFGIDSEAISESRRPTRQTARWVFCFATIHDVPNRPKGTGGEVANARVCKTCIRGFDSRPVLQK